MRRPQPSDQADIAPRKPTAHEPWSGGLEGNPIKVPTVIDCRTHIWPKRAALEPEITIKNRGKIHNRDFTVHSKRQPRSWLSHRVSLLIPHDPRVSWNLCESHRSVLLMYKCYGMQDFIHIRRCPRRKEPISKMIHSIQRVSKLHSGAKAYSVNIFKNAEDEA